MGLLNSKAAAVAAGVLAAGLVFYLLARRGTGAVGDAASAVGTAVNPLDSDNVFARGVDAIGDVLDDADDNDSFSLGSWLFDLTHPEYDPNADTYVPEDDRVKLLAQEPIR